MKFKSDIMDEAAMLRALTRIAHEIVERNDESGDICVIGIMRRGVPLAEIIAEKLRSPGMGVSVGSLDITLHRDDIEAESAPRLNNTDIDFSVTGKTVVMVDDVLFTGRTARAGMDALIALGRPAKIQLAVLIDRGHRELPIRADYVGKNIPTSRNEIVSVKIAPFDGETSVKLYQK